ncbi:MAG: MnhB domain-containing protein [Microthrixaceae bacterium]
MSGPTGNRRSVILTETVNGITPILLLFSIFLTFRGHNAPGGGFAGGLVMGSAVILRYLASGPAGIRSLRIDPIMLIGAGLTLALAVGTTSLFADGSFLESAIWKFEVPVIGKIKFVSSSLFDIGVHILVVGVVMAVLVAFAEADDEVGGRQSGGTQGGEPKSSSRQGGGRQ